MGNQLGSGMGNFLGSIDWSKVNWGGMFGGGQQAGQKGGDATSMWGGMTNSYVPPAYQSGNQDLTNGFGTGWGSAFNLKPR
jgi:hypothetical protein